MEEEIIYEYVSAQGSHGMKFCVKGTPVPQGSMNAYSRGGKVRMVHSKGKSLDAWRCKVGSYFKQIMFERKDIFQGDIAILLRLRFVFHAPRTRKKEINHSVYGKLPRCVKPDLDKLVRAIGDGFTQATGVDDSKICVIYCEKEETYDEIAECVFVEMYVHPRKEFDGRTDWRL